MKKLSYRILFSIFAAASVMVSCKETFKTEEPQDDGMLQGVYKELLAEIPDFTPAGDGAKVIEVLSGSNIRSSWEIGDLIGLWPSQADVHVGDPEQVPFFYIGFIPEHKRSRFDSYSWGLIKNHIYYAYSPYSPSATYNNVVIDYQGQRQTENKSTAHLGRFDYMHSTADVQPVDTTVRMGFTHLGCIDDFTLTIPEEYRTDTFSKLVLSCGSPCMVYKASYNPSVSSVALTATQKVTDFTIDLGADDAHGISCDANGQLRIYAAMCRALTDADWAGKTVTLTLYGEGKNTFTGTISPSASQQAGRIYSFNVNMAYSGPVITDLSRLETANCYIVSAAGDYKFRATKGNSDATVTPASVKVLWETVNTSTAPAQYSLIKNDGLKFEDGYIFFSTADAFTKGNASIAAYDGANGTGNILWSWHIWLTDTPADQEYPNDAGYLMDRNLGALSTSGNLSVGFLYQWGRKDPMPGNIATNSTISFSYAGKSFGFETNSSTVGIIDWSIKNPTKFILEGTNGDWIFANNDRTRWYGNNGTEDVKTQYDPCPPGYRIPYAGHSVSEKDFWGTAYNFSGYLQANGYEFDFNGIKSSFVPWEGLNMPLADGTWAYYPTTGWIDQKGVRQNTEGKHVMIWENYPAGTGNAFTEWNTQYSAVMDINMTAGKLSSHYNSTRADGKSVRCMRMAKNVELASDQDNENFHDPVPSAW